MTPEKIQLINLGVDLLLDLIFLIGLGLCFWALGSLMKTVSGVLDNQIKLGEALVQHIEKTNEWRVTVEKRLEGVFPNKFKVETEKMQTRGGFSQ